MDRKNEPWVPPSKHGDYPAGKALIQVRQGIGRAEVCLDLLGQGRDLLLLVTGGQAHVGAVAVAGPGPAKEIDYTGLLTVPGHKEGPLAEYCAEQMARTAGCQCAAVVGIHQDQATRQEIDDIVANVKEGMGQLLEQWRLAKETHD